MVAGFQRGCLGAVAGAVVALLLLVFAALARHTAVDDADPAHRARPGRPARFAADPSSRGQRLVTGVRPRGRAPLVGGVGLAAATRVGRAAAAVLGGSA